MIRFIPSSIISKEISRKIIVWVLDRFVFHFNSKKVATVLEIKLDARSGMLKCVLDLKGEPLPLIIERFRYSIVSRADGSYLVPEELTTNREWINVISKMHIGKEFGPLPETMVSVLGVIM